MILIIKGSKFLCSVCLEVIYQKTNIYMHRELLNIASNHQVGYMSPLDYGDLFCDEDERERARPV